MSSPGSYDTKIAASLPRLQKGLLLSGIAIALVLLTALLTSLTSTFIADGAIDREFCFHRACLDEALRLFALPIGVVKILGAFAVGFTTLLGLVVALGVYLSNSKLVEQHAQTAITQADSLREQAKSSALQLHAVRFSSFREYVVDAVGRCSRLGLSSIDVTSWYFKIFPNAYEGDIAVNAYYIEAVKRISAAMLAADERLGPAAKRFNYGEHQRVLIPMLAEIGIRLYSLPRLDYFLIEDEVVELIASVHRVFGIESITFGDRKYRGVS
ncbi:retron Ec48 family effector membrane protein [Luteimonas suaedae]|uniref:retron Ec48 family effector membrane protein n=1 Tax=Luteimonas suaedae TaxID=2605430 RepID=UPI0011F0526F|nr:retron Ec48 family effector membrane protein [Luteimonas suaedae]